MEENKQQQQQIESGEQQSNDSADYIKAINELKQNSVSREQYEKLKNENKELLDTLINGGQVEMIDPATKPSVEDLRKGLFSKEAAEKEMTNLEFVSKSLELRNAIIESGGTDPFLPVGRGIDVTREDYEAAEFTAQQFQECIDIAKGNSEVFTAELMRRTVDNSLPAAKKSNLYRR
jgi:hypothetical protein